MTHAEETMAILEAAGGTDIWTSEGPSAPTTSAVYLSHPATSRALAAA